MNETTTATTTEAPAAKPTTKPARKASKPKAKPAKKLAAKATKPSAKSGERDKRLPKPGSVIKRTYLGKDYTVKVKTDSFEFNGKPYTSLTAVAKALRKSDQEVNGFAFFGLTK